MSGKNNRLKVNALTGLAKTQLKQQKIDAAKATLAKAQPLGADASPMWLETSGDAAALSNDADSALSFWQKAKEKGAKSTILDKKITEKKYLD
jgi:predicted negative regulator of RcsB-dependent stress response